ncbi:hypothetical protein FM130_13650 [Enterococcus faecium]|nr:hypothetical protein FM130_13650 [Enterococcus faecium]
MLKRNRVITETKGIRKDRTTSKQMKNRINCILSEDISSVSMGASGRSGRNIESV